MKTNFTPHLVSLCTDSLLKSFWRKKALSRFLQASGVSLSFLSTWMNEETKREFVDRLISDLSASEKGRLVIFKMARSLIEQESFPDLDGWEDSNLKIKDVKQAVRNLKNYLNSQTEEIKSEELKVASRKRLSEIQQKAIESRQNLDKLSKELTMLSENLGKASAGLEFEKWFFDLMLFFEINHRRPYKTGGRQIDGSVTIAGTTYLVELKFTSTQTPSGEIDSFFKKIITKADNTMGIFVSMSGYSSTAIKEASSARTPMILLDHSHVYHCLGGIMSFEEIVDRVRRHASQTGEAYLPVKGFGGMNKAI